MPSESEGRSKSRGVQDVHHEATLEHLKRVLQDAEASTRLDRLLELAETEAFLDEQRDTFEAMRDKIAPHHLLRARSPDRGDVKSSVKLSLEVTPEMNEMLQELVHETHASGKSDVLRKAIALMKVAVDAKKQGKKVGIAEKDQPLATEIVGLGF